MGSFADERAAIEKRLKDNWTTTPIAFDNVGFRPTDSEYIAIFIQNASATQIELTGSTPRHRYTGLISIQIFVDANSGSQNCKKLCRYDSRDLSEPDF